MNEHKKLVRNCWLGFGAIFILIPSVQLAVYALIVGGLGSLMYLDKSNFKNSE